MSTGTTLAMATALAGLLGAGLSQDSTQAGSQASQPAQTSTLASYNDQTAPTLALLPNQYNLTNGTFAFSTFQDGNQEPRVSAHFDKASASDVIDWLQKNGVNFMLKDSQLPKDASITLNVTDQPVSDVVEALGEALGGHWDKHGQIYVYRPEAGIQVFGGDGMKSNLFKGFNPGDEKAMQGWMGKDGASFKMNADQMKKAMEQLKTEMPQMKEEIRKAMEEAQKSQKDGVYSYKLSKPDMDKAMEMLKGMPQMQKDGNFNQFFKTMPQGGQTWVFPKDFKGGSMWKSDGKGGYTFIMPPMDGKMWKQFGTPGKNGMMWSMPKGGYSYAMPKMDDKVWKQFMQPGKEGMFGGKGWTSFQKVDFPGFMKTLTPSQKKAMKDRGYIKISELSAAQRKMLGVSADAKHYTLSYSNGNSKVVIKSGN